MIIECANLHCKRKIAFSNNLDKCDLSIPCRCGTQTRLIDGNVLINQQNNSRKLLDSFQNNMNLKKKSGATIKNSD